LQRLSQVTAVVLAAAQAGGCVNEGTKALEAVRQLQQLLEDAGRQAQSDVAAAAAVAAGDHKDGPLAADLVRSSLRRLGSLTSKAGAVVEQLQQLVGLAQAAAAASLSRGAGTAAGAVADGSGAVRRVDGASSGSPSAAQQQEGSMQALMARSRALLDAIGKGPAAAAGSQQLQQAQQQQQQARQVWQPDRIPGPLLADSRQSEQVLEQLQELRSSMRAQPGSAQQLQAQSQQVLQSVEHMTVIRLKQVRSWLLAAGRWLLAAGSQTCSSACSAAAAGLRCFV
jgi:hypothetical protein